MSNTRNKTIDMMKGCAILSVVYYHLSSDLGPVIHSFALPLFFILSGYFAKDVCSWADFGRCTTKSCKRLLLPYLVTFVFLMINGGVNWLSSGSPDILLSKIQLFFWAGADITNTEYGRLTLGPLWFLIALFWVRELFALLQMVVSRFRYPKKIPLCILLCLSILISVASVLIWPVINPAPLSFFQGGESLVFYAVGFCAKRGLFPKWLYYVAVACWPVSIVCGGINLMFCYLKLYPLSVIGACGGTYLVYLVCKWVESLCRLSFLRLDVLRPLVWCGRFSLAILCMHCIDMLSDTYLWLMNLLPFNYGGWGVIGFRFALAILLAIVVTRIPFLRKVYA